MLKNQIITQEKIFATKIPKKLGFRMYKDLPKFCLKKNIMQHHVKWIKSRLPADHKRGNT